jgi:hypothetical protein
MKRFHQTSSSLLVNNVTTGKLVRPHPHSHSHLRALRLPSQAPNAHAIDVQRRYLFSAGLQGHHEVVKVVGGFVICHNSIIGVDGA